MKKYIWAALSVLCAAGIFISSSIEGRESGAASMAIAAGIRQIFSGAAQPGAPEEAQLDLINWLVRKAAHFAVFFALSFCLANAFKYLRGKRAFWPAWGIGAAYGVLDELHQSFVPGRECAAGDMLINAAGALCGALIAYILLIRSARKGAA